MGRSVQLPYNHVYYRSLKSAAVRCCYSELGPSLCFVARSCLPLHPTTLHPTRLQRKQVSVKPEPRSPSYAASKTFLIRKVFAAHTPDFRLR